MNVLQIAEYAAPYSGNFILSLENLREELERLGGNMVYLLPERTQKQIWVEELIDKGALIYFYTNNIFKNIRILKKIVKNHKIKCFHVHFIHRKIVLPVTLVHIFTPKSILFSSVHGEYRKKSFIKEKISRLIRFSTYYIGVSKPVCEQIVNSGIKEKKVVCVENAVVFKRLDTFETLTNQIVGITNTTKKILTFGYNWELKGVNLSLKAVDLLRKKDENIALFIVFASNKEKNKQKIIEIFGEIPSWVFLLEPRNDIATYYNFCDLFIAPSISEGYNYSLVEASYCMMPVLASDISAHKNLKLLDNVYFESGNYKDLAAKIEYSLKNYNIESLRKQKNNTINNWSIERWTKEIICIYNKYKKS